MGRSRLQHVQLGRKSQLTGHPPLACHFAQYNTRRSGGLQTIYLKAPTGTSKERENYMLVPASALARKTQTAVDHLNVQEVGCELRKQAQQSESHGRLLLALLVNKTLSGCTRHAAQKALPQCCSPTLKSRLGLTVKSVDRHSQFSVTNFAGAQPQVATSLAFSPDVLSLFLS